MASIGINGFGRIGCLFLRAALAKKLNVVAINDESMNPKSIAYQMKYDSTYGRYKTKIEYGTDYVSIGSRKIKITCKQHPSEIPWSEVGVKYVLESTGQYTTEKELKNHLLAGAKKVILTAPSEVLPTIVMGVNVTDYKPTLEFISAASSTTSCLAPLFKYLHEEHNITECLMTAIQSPTESQQCMDGISPHAWREGRSCLQSILPSTLDLATTFTKVIPDLCGKVTGTSFIAPVAGASIAHLAVYFKQPVDFNIFKDKMRIASNGFMKGFIGYEDKEIVSSDLRQNKTSSIFDSKASEALSPTFMKLVAWYDPEWSFANRLADLMNYIIEADKHPCGKEKPCKPCT